MNKNETRWHLEKMSSKADAKGIINLRKKVFTGEDIDKENLDFWNWEFEENYFGKAKIFLAKDEEKVVGHYAICPSRITINGREAKGSIVVDVMTDPDYRYQGMFTKIGKFGLDEAGKEGIDFSYGFPIRKGVMPGHLKVGWKIAFPLPVYAYPVDFQKVFHKFVPVKALSYILGALPQLLFAFFRGFLKLRKSNNEIRSCNRFVCDESLKQFISETKNQHSIIQPRDFDFLDWRYNKNKYRNYTILSCYCCDNLLGYVVLRETEIYGLDCITIVDIQVKKFDKVVIRELLISTYRLAKEKKAALVGCMINNNAYKHELLKFGFLKTPYIFKMILHDNNHSQNMNELEINENWYLSWGDTDDL